jgi:hypothetical protein
LRARHPGKKPTYDARFREEVRTALEEEGENIPTKKWWPERACAMRAAQCVFKARACGAQARQDPRPKKVFLQQTPSSTRLSQRRARYPVHRFRLRKGRAPNTRKMVVLPKHIIA